MEKNLQKYINRINELYITNRKKYLVLSQKGNYITGGIESRCKIKKPLVDADIRAHLNGVKTFGVFGGKELSKFICFDIDVKEKQLAKWHAYKLIEVLIEIGIPSDRIYPSTSGNKGYHIEIFFENVVSNVKIQKFFTLVMEIANYSKAEEYAYKCEGGMIELRPVADKLGVKLPLGKHFKTKNQKRCWFVDVESLNEIRSNSFIMDIKQIDNNVFEYIFEKEQDLTLEDEKKKLELGKLQNILEEKYEPLTIYRQNIDNAITIEKIKKIEQVGIQQIGTRHNLLFQLAKYYRYQGLSNKECSEQLVYWMEKQNKSKYSTSWKECLIDIEKIVDYIYINEINLTVHNTKITIYEEELLKIAKLEKKCQRLFSFAMLVHSKRFAQPNRVFYMTQKQISEATGYSERQVRRELDNLEEYGIFSYVARNQIIKNEKGQFVGKRPNKYKMSIIFEDNGEVDIKRFTFEIIDHQQYSDSYKESFGNLFDLATLREMLPKREYNEIRKHAKAS